MAKTLLNCMQFKDKETGLYHNAFFSEVLKLELGRSKRNFQPVTVVAIKLTQLDTACFKHITDSIRDGDIATIGGDTVYIHFHNTRNPDAYAAANRIKSVCRDECTIGIATTHVPFMSVSELLRQAEHAMKKQVNGIGKVQIGTQKVSSE